MTFGARGPRNDSGEPKGFTIIEILVSLAIVGALLGFLFQIFITQQRTHLVQEELADAQDNARVALQELTRVLASLGTGVDQSTGQRRFLLAERYQIVFNADLDAGHKALAPGTTIPGTGIPGQPIPAGTFTGSDPAETYRYTLDRNGDGTIDASDRTSGEHYTLFREVNGSKADVAFSVANPRIEAPLFRYFGDFDGTGTARWVDRVDASTSSRVAAGEPLDAVIRSVEVNVIAEPEHKDTRYPQNDGYRQATFRTAVTPSNFWDCPMIAPLSGIAGLAAPDLRDSTLPIRFAVTRSGAPEAGRTVQFSLSALTTPPGQPVGAVVTDVAGSASSDRTGADGTVTAVVRWPTGCGQIPEGAYTITARTAEPPPLAGSFGTCSSHSASVSFQVMRGLPAAVTFDADPLRLDSCGASVSTTYHLVDDCGRVLDPGDYSANPIHLVIGPDPVFGSLSATVLATEPGTLTYQSPDRPYAAFPTVSRSPAEPNVFQAVIQATNSSGNPAGSTKVEVELKPGAMVNRTNYVPSTAFTDCPEPALPVTESFGVSDACGNLLHGLTGADAVGVSLSPAAIQRGAIASPDNRAAFLPDPLAVTRNDGTPGQPERFSIQYQAPTCTVGGAPLDAQILLVPSWSASGSQTLPLRVDACGGCSVSLTDANGAPAASLGGSCEGQSWVTVTECVPAGTTAELVIGPEAGSIGSPSFARSSAQDRLTVSFNAGTRGQVAKVPVFTGTAGITDRFRVAAYIPDQATAQALGGPVCRSNVLPVENRCAGILITPLPANSEAATSTLTANDAPLCGAEGNTVYFRIRDCDQNKYPTLIEKIRAAPGTARGLLVRILDSGGQLIDEESPELTESTIQGTNNADSPFFQGSLTVTRDQADASFSGHLKAPLDQPATLEVRYVDPDDASDNLCLARALLIPPYPVCLSEPALSWGDWEGDLLAHGGDAAVLGNLSLPSAAGLISKNAAASLTPQPYGPGNEDRFFDAYVGGAISVAGQDLGMTGTLNQPFLPGGSGEALGTSFGNYFQNVPDAATLLSRLDYTALKSLARIRGVYWEAEAGGTIVNPMTGVRGTLEEITRLPGPGIASQTYDGRFLFVDAQPAFQSAAAVGQADAQQLPVHVVAGPYFSAGLIYVAGSVVFQTDAGKQPVTIEVASGLDGRYDENQGGLGRQDLPIDYVTSAGRTAAGSLDVNLAGALYCAGRVELPPGFRVYGVVAGEKGVSAAQSAEIWYDPRWRESKGDACFRGCGSP